MASKLGKIIIDVRNNSIVYDSETLVRIEEVQRELAERYKPLTDANRDSARLTAEDYAVTILSPSVRYR